MKRSDKKQISNYSRFILLPLATLLYVYGVISLTTVATMLVVLALRGDWANLGEITPGQLLTLVVGVAIFFPAQKFRQRIKKNSIIQYRF
jgi:hypothetical protein